MAIHANSPLQILCIFWHQIVFLALLIQLGPATQLSQPATRICDARMQKFVLHAVLRGGDTRDGKEDGQEELFGEETTEVNAAETISTWGRDIGISMEDLEGKPSESLSSTMPMDVDNDDKDQQAVGEEQEEAVQDASLLAPTEGVQQELSLTQFMLEAMEFAERHQEGGGRADMLSSEEDKDLGSIQREEIEKFIEEYIDDLGADRFEDPPCRYDGYPDVLVAGGRGLNISDQPLLQSYNFAQDRWRTEMSMGFCRLYPAACAWRGNMFVFGGLECALPLDVVERFDRGSGRWSLEGRMPEPLFGCGVVEMRNRIYVLGGQDRRFNTVETVRSWDPREGKW
eukprot:70652-Hanusia_phi.AAC.1